MNLDSGFWKGRSVFITGTTGLLGGWLTPALIRRGANVIALIRDTNPDARSTRVRLENSWIDHVTVIRGALCDEDVIPKALAEHSVQTVFHLGGQTLIGVANTDPVGTLEANVRGTWLLLEQARHSSVEQIIIASSCKAYGDLGQPPYHEDLPLRGRFPYDVSKSCADLIASMYARSFAVPVAIVRCGNLFGGGDLNFSRLIPGVISATLTNQPFCIRSDGKSVRDFLYVEDAAEAYLWLAERMASDHCLHGEAFNFGLQLRCTMLEVTEKVLYLMGRSDLRPLIQNATTAEATEQTLDVTKARERLRWIPRYGLDQGLRLTIEWYTQFLSGAGKEREIFSTAVA